MNILQVVNHSSAINKAQLVMDEEGTVNVPIRNWSAFLATFSKRIPDIKSFHQFTCNADRKGMLGLAQRFW